MSRLQRRLKKGLEFKHKRVKNCVRLGLCRPIGLWKYSLYWVGRYLKETSDDITYTYVVFMS